MKHFIRVILLLTIHTNVQAQYKDTLDKWLLNQAKQLMTEDRQLSSITTYTYAANDSLYKEVNYDIQNGNAVFKYADIYDYNDKNALATFIRYMEIPSSDYPETHQWKYFYDNNGHIAFITFQIKESAQKDTLFTQDTKNAIGKTIITIEIRKRAYNHHYKTIDSTITHYSYDTVGNLTQKKVTKAGRYTHTYTYRYNMEGLLSSTELVNDAIGFYERTLYQYDSKGNEIQIQTFNKQHKLIEERKYRYDNQHRKTAEYLYRDNKCAYIYKQNYNQAGNIRNRSTYNGEHKLESFQQYNYNARGKITSVFTYINPQREKSPQTSTSTTAEAP